MVLYSFILLFIFFLKYAEQPLDAVWHVFVHKKNFLFPQYVVCVQITCASRLSRNNHNSILGLKSLFNVSPIQCPGHFFWNPNGAVAAINLCKSRFIATEGQTIAGRPRAPSSKRDWTVWGVEAGLRGKWRRKGVICGALCQASKTFLTPAASGTVRANPRQEELLCAALVPLELKAYPSQTGSCNLLARTLT